MKLFIAGSGPLYDQAARLAAAAGLELSPDAAEADYILPLSGEAAPEGKALFDYAAWELCASRSAANERLRAHGVPLPEAFPGGSEPYIIKPDNGGFGVGVDSLDDYCEVGGAVNAGYLAEEELPGEVWSVAVTGAPGGYKSWPAARLGYDDRRRRTAAECAAAPGAKKLAETARAAAEAVGVRGILEVEAMRHKNVWKVIDLNARLPLLTPDALLEKRVNLLEEIIKVYE